MKNDEISIEQIRVLMKLYGFTYEKACSFTQDEITKLFSNRQSEISEEKQDNAYKNKITETFEEANEFRYIKNHENKKVQGHPAHVYAKNEEKAKYLQMTHSQFIKDMAEANIELKNNPNSRDPDTAYVVPKSQIANLDDLGKVIKGWKLSEIDNETLIIYRDKPFNEKR